MHNGFHLFTTEQGDQQARDGEEYPQEQIKQPAEQEPIEHAMMLVLYDGNRLNVDVGAAAFRTDHLQFPLYHILPHYIIIQYEMLL
jgi:hypothetical protein